jgi:hypothetical protein
MNFTEQVPSPCHEAMAFERVDIECIVTGAVSSASPPPVTLNAWRIWSSCADLKALTSLSGLDIAMHIHGSRLL